MVVARGPMDLLERDRLGHLGVVVSCGTCPRERNRLGVVLVDLDVVRLVYLVVIVHHLLVVE